MEALGRVDERPEVEVGASASDRTLGSDGDVHTPLEDFSATRRRSSFTVESLGDSASSVTTSDGEVAGAVESSEDIEEGAAPKGPRNRRRSSVSVRSSSGQSYSSAQSYGSESTHRQRGRRRTNMGKQSGSGSSGADGDSHSIEESSSSVIGNAGRVGKSVRRASINLASVAGSSFDISSRTLSSAVETLGKETSDWENVAAAASIVAVAEGGGQRKHMLFSVKDKVLVFLTLLNHTNQEDEQEDFTVNPVNKFGFPKGSGKAIHEQQGPYNYVLCTVLKVHFDEDDRYYTVARADTGTEQRADSAWMEPLRSVHGLEEAMKAAKQTGRSISMEDSMEKPNRGLKKYFDRCIMSIHSYVKKVLLPFYRRIRLSAKEKLTHVLQGDNPFACKFRFTSINFLVLCSFIYLFLEVIQYSFFPSSWDYGLTIVSLVAWCVLVLELFFEWAIRPSDYFAKITSELAYAPSTARHINRFHLVTESIALLLFIPQFDCIATGQCGKATIFTTLDAALAAILGPDLSDAVYGRVVIGLSGFRFVGLVRHWKEMWLTHTFTDHDAALDYRFLHDLLIKRWVPGSKPSFRQQKLQEKSEDDEYTYADVAEPEMSEENQELTKAATIGTALMVVNSHRFMVILVSIMTLLPMIMVLEGVNNVSPKAVDLLQVNNVVAGDDCAYFGTAVRSWLRTFALVQTNSNTRFDEDTYVLWAQVLPVRCSFQDEDGVITRCRDLLLSAPDETIKKTCEFWADGPNASEATPEFFADRMDVRVGGIVTIVADNVTNVENVTAGDFYVRVMFNQNNVVTLTNFTLFLLLLSFLCFTLWGLSVLRFDARRLVLDPLQRMLKIVIRYAENPLAKTPRQRTYTNRQHNEVGDSSTKQLGNYETEQLINAITKIADLLRKCWGIAGADIISSTLARSREGKSAVFNVTAKGKRVYALFGFVGIIGFSELLRALDRDVMILINDVAKVVHDNVFRWGLGDSGQCNKNLGGAFLMVYRIGDFDEVRERQKRATDVVFEARDKGIRKKTSNLRRRKGHSSHGQTVGSRDRRSAMYDDTLALASLPGIQSFTDRALLGMLKAFAGLYREQNLQRWCRDFRLGAGVGAFSVEIMVGMDAGWAVEGAVGSEYKIDATYLSPHVNMAARMMTASQQYGVTILMSQAVEELLSVTARSKLRHLDTVFVKGSQVKQRIFTYDAKSAGVDFFLFDKSDEQADQDSENYTQQIWDVDQDLISMRQHVTEKFQNKFERGKRQYLAGNWKAAIETLKEADDIMILTVLEEGYIDYNPDEIDPRIFDRKNVSDEFLRMRQDLGDGACKTLIKYMENRKGKPPPDWDGVRPLTSK